MTTKRGSTRNAAADTLSLEQFGRFRDLIEERYGLHLDECHRDSLSASLRVWMQQLNLDRVDDYYDHLRSRPQDEGFGDVINQVTVTETCFFRDPLQFRLLRRHILPALLAERAAGGKASLRIWSAGCSSGEEAYSIALTLWEMGWYPAHSKDACEIVGTDVNTKVLDAARRGVYSARALRNVDSARRRRYFQRVGPDFRLNEEVRRRVRFEHGNLTRTPLMRSSRGYDLVLCKNVAIYFRPERTRRLVRDLCEAVNDGGYLLFGHSESLWQLAEGFTLIEHEGAFCYRKVGSASKGGDKPSGLSSSISAEPRGLPRAGLRAVRRPARRPLESTPPQPRRETSLGHYERCLAEVRAEAWAQAEASLAALVTSSPDFVLAYLLLGGVYAHRGRYDEAYEQARCLLRLNDLEPRGHLLQGMIAAWRGRASQARQSLRRALYLNDSLALAHFWLGNLYRDRGDLNRACHEYQNVVRDWERQTLDFTEELASGLTAEQLVEVCRRSIQLLETRRVMRS